MFIINDAPQLSGNIAMINQSQKRQKGEMILGVQPRYEGEHFVRTSDLTHFSKDSYGFSQRDFRTKVL